MPKRGKPIELCSRDKLLQARLAELQDRFVSRLAEDRANLVRARIASDDMAMRNLAHRLAGVSASFGYPKIGDAAVRLQAAIDSGHGPRLVRPAFDCLVAMLADPGSYAE